MLAQRAAAAAASVARRSLVAPTPAGSTLRPWGRPCVPWMRGSGARGLAEQAAQEAAGGASAWLKARADFAQSKVRLLAAAALGLVAINAGASAALSFFYHKNVLDTLLQGVLPPPEAPPVLPRPELRRRIRELLQPPEPRHFYQIVTGPPGGGKSTLVKGAVREIGGGVGYLDVAPAFEVDFGRDLGDAFGFRFQEHMKKVNMVFKPVLGTQWEEPGGKHPLASVRQTAEALHDAAQSFKRKTGRPFLLVIDSADRLCRREESERVLVALREYARDWAQEGTISTVFVCAEFSTVQTLLGDHPAQSRAGPPLRVPDITQAEALQYLRALGVPEEHAEQCADLAGGSLLLLQRCSDLLKAGLPFEDAKAQLLDFIEMAYLHAGLLDASPHQHGGLAAIEALLASKTRGISAAEWRGCVPGREQQRALLSKGVMSFDGDGLHFASNLAATYAAERLQHKLPAAVVDQHPQLLKGRRSSWWG